MEITEFSAPVQAALAKMNITSLSEVQQCIPDVMKGKDLLCQAPTGSGKTLAFLLPAVERLAPQGKGKHFPAVLILVPTRELALQTADTARSLLSTQEGFRTAVLTGGTDIQVQIRSFSRGADIVIATPARLLDHLRRHTFKPKNCRMLILDEADVMLSMGFEKDVRAAAASLPDHQTLLFSATYPDAIRALSADLQNDPERFSVKESRMLEQKTEFRFYLTPEKNKNSVLLSLLKKNRGSCLVFVNTRKGADAAAAFLRKNGIRAEALHSMMEQKDRRRIISDFRSGLLPVMTATDVASRGIDIPAVRLVICYDLPDSDTDLVHRCGRTSRAATRGTCCLLVRPDEKKRISAIRSLFHLA